MRSLFRIQIAQALLDRMLGDRCIGSKVRKALDREIDKSGEDRCKIVKQRCGLPMCIQFFRRSATGRMEFSVRLVLSSNSGYSARVRRLGGTDFLSRHRATSTRTRLWEQVRWLSACRTRELVFCKRLKIKSCGSRTCKPNSVCRIAPAGRSFLWATHYCEAQATYPEVVTRRAGTFSQTKFSPRLSPSLFGLAPCGVCHARCITAAAVRSYRTFSPLPRCRGGMFSVALAVNRA
jgi:hypothetical protein